jgi:hypothetical protein
MLRMQIDPELPSRACYPQLGVAAASDLINLVRRLGYQSSQFKCY